MHLFFGPNLRYFFDDGKGNYRYRAPAEFVGYLKKTPVTKIHHVAFGIGDSYFVSYTLPNGTIGANFELEDHYPKLHNWIYTEGLAHDFSQVYVSLGLDGAFWGSSNQGHRWHKLPDEALEYYQKFTSPNLFLTKRVHTIDLGYKDTFSGIGVDNTWFWDLGDQYPHFSSLNLQKELPKAKHTMINPFAPDQHFAVFADGSTHYSLPQEWAGDIAALFQQYASQTVQTVQAPSPQYAIPQYARPTYANPTFVRPQLAQPTVSPPPQKPDRWWRRSSSSSSNPTSPHTANPNVGTNFGAAYQQPAQSNPLDFFKQYGQSHQQHLAQASGYQPNQQQQQQPSTLNEALQLGNNVFDAYNNVTNAGSQSGGSSGGGFDINQAMSTMQSSVNTLNTVTGAGGQGMDLVNQIANNGLMVGQVAGQFVGAAAGCAVM